MMFSLPTWMPALLLLACSQEPAAPAVVEPPRPSVESLERKRKLSELKSRPNTAAALVYKKAEGVYVDARYLGQQSFSVARAEIEQQLGAVVEETELPPGQGQQIRLEKGTLRVQNDRIYLVDVALPEPMRRDQVLGFLGFPPTPNVSWTSFSGEFRLMNAWGFRRVIFSRKERNSEDIIRVQAWRTLGEQ
jgi:hypothetical protein